MERPQDQIKIGAVIAAAGLSARMKDFKPLLPLSGGTIIGRAIQTLQAAGISPLVVVTGHCSQRLQEYLKPFGVTCLHNPDYQHTDMFTSICLGLAVIQERTDHVFVLPADTPLFSLPSIITMIEESICNDDDVLLPQRNGTAGHPILIKSSIIPALLSYRGEEGIKGAIQVCCADKRIIEIPDIGITLDADTAWDYELMRLLTDETVPENIREHAALVARLAVSLGRKLKRAGYKLDLHQIELAALLHDIAREQPNHDEQGGRLLEEIGQPGLAAIVRQHMRLLPDQEDIISEITIVYLADKYAAGSHIVTLEQRFRQKRANLRDGPEALSSLEANYGIAHRLERVFENVLGCRLHPRELLKEDSPLTRHIPQEKQDLDPSRGNPI